MMINHTLLLATDNGLVFGDTKDWAETSRSLTGKRINAVIAREGVILAGVTDGIYRSDDGGQNWSESNQGLTQNHIRWLAFHPYISDLEFAGTEPAGIFVSKDGGESWLARPEVQDFRDEFGWFLPYSPEAGCVRGFSFHGDRFYAAVEVGGLLRSDDGGETWDLAPGSDGIPKFGPPVPGKIHPDVHSVEVHPSSADMVFAPTGGGFYVSENGGQSWQQKYRPCYCRAVWVDPQDPDHIILGPADSVDRNGRISRTTDNGQTWEDLNAGLDTPWPRHMVERFLGLDHTLFALLSNGHLLVSSLNNFEWRRVFKGAGRINCVAKFYD